MVGGRGRFWNFSAPARTQSPSRDSSVRLGPASRFPVAVLTGSWTNGLVTLMRAAQSLGLLASRALGSRLPIRLVAREDTRGTISGSSWDHMVIRITARTDFCGNLRPCCEAFFIGRRWPSY